MDDGEKENVVDIFTKNKIDKRKKPSNQIKLILDRFAEFLDKSPQRSIVICSVDDKGERMTDYLVLPDDFDKMCILLGTIADEMSDLSMGFVDLEDEE